MSYYIGVMSGTSLDGIDVAIISFSDSAPFQLITAQTFPFPDSLYKKIHSLILDPSTHLQELGSVDIELGQLIGNSVNQLLNSKHISTKDIIAIGSHGQTLFHSPNDKFPFSMQIGNANEIAEITGITTIADFRQRDIAAGGQGAPLVPAFHQNLFRSNDEDRVIVNIGGISNITVLPSSVNATVLGFDTGPGNGLLDYWVQSKLGKSYDNSGQWAQSGQCNPDLLNIFLHEGYFRQKIPKSTGRELFNNEWLHSKLTEYTDKISDEDVQATLVELTALTIANDVHHYAESSKEIFICGGGAHNIFLLTRLQHHLGDKKVSTTSSLNLDADWVEACAFAWLAFRTMNKRTGNLPSVTGASREVILGSIYPA